MPHFIVIEKNCLLTSSPSKYDKIKTVRKWGIWTPTGVLVGYYHPTLGVGVWGSLNPPNGVLGVIMFYYYRLL